MKPSESTVPAAVGQVERVVSPQRRTEAGVVQCLVSSASKTRRNMLSRAATDAGWDTILCSTPEKALSEFQRNMFYFAMVDLVDRGETTGGARELVQTLAQDSAGILIGVCGHEANPEEEIWIRQLGIWLYLPSVTTSTEVSSLCKQALQIVSKRWFDQELTVQ
jgi:hypothetical protein